MKVATHLIPFDSLDERADVLVNGDLLPLHSQHLQREGREKECYEPLNGRSWTKGSRHGL
jgi:hypothetical protein